MHRYEAIAQRRGPAWSVEVAGIGSTEGRTAAEAREQAARLVTDQLGVPVSEVSVDVRFALESRLEQEIAEARRAAREAQHAQERAAELSRKAVRDLKSSGMTGKDVATVLGLSPQRVSQLSR